MSEILPGELITPDMSETEVERLDQEMADEIEAVKNL